MMRTNSRIMFQETVCWLLSLLYSRVKSCPKSHAIVFFIKLYKTWERKWNSMLKVLWRELKIMPSYKGPLLREVMRLPTKSMDMVNSDSMMMPIFPLYSPCLTWGSLTQMMKHTKVQEPTSFQPKTHSTFRKNHSRDKEALTRHDITFGPWHWL